MPFIYRKKLSGDLKQLISNAKKIATKTGCTISGDEHNGRFYGKTVVGEIGGSYTVTNGVIRITIQKKPFMVSEVKLASAFDAYFSLR